ncbi:uncharacterized protein LOC123211296 [Mangifera indica]|uniref:uncharacterized protein LOC123211296 n=1 Tax=Mangifera indica TaxID=29780 RepID=UPI001CF9AE06|nr:uncharacterized protein LOC123211296 [Mangifera indica]
MEITVLSAQGLKNSSSTLFSNRVRPFINITTYSPTTTSGGDKQCHVYKTRVDDEGGVNPTWGDRFHLPTDNTFFTNRYSCIYLQVYTKRLIAGQTLLGWCQVPVNDIGFPSVGSVRYLSYRLRDRDGSRGQGVVNLAVKLENIVPVAGENFTQPLNTEDTYPVIGIPITVCTHVKDSVS